MSKKLITSQRQAVNKLIDKNWDPFSLLNVDYKEAVVRRYSVRKVFLKFSQNSQENTCTRVSF